METESVWWRRGQSVLMRTSQRLEGEQSKTSCDCNQEALQMTLWGEVLHDDILISRNSEANCSSAHPSMRGITRTLSQSLSQQSLKIARSHLVHLLCKPIIPCVAPADPVTSSEQASVLSTSGLASHRSTTSEPFEAKSWGRNYYLYFVSYFIYHYWVSKHIPGREGNSLSFL